MKLEDVVKKVCGSGLPALMRHGVPDVDYIVQQAMIAVGITITDEGYLVAGTETLQQLSMAVPAGWTAPADASRRPRGRAPHRTGAKVRR